MEVIATEIADQFSKFKSGLFTSIIDKLRINKAGSFLLRFGKNNRILLIGGKDKVDFLFGVHFNQNTDISLARIYLKEVEESKKKISVSLMFKYFSDLGRLDGNLKSLFDVTEFNCGVLQTSLYVKSD